MHFSAFKICSQNFFKVSAILHHISLLRLLPNPYFKIGTLQPNFLCSSSFNLVKQTEIKAAISDGDSDFPILESHIYIIIVY